MSINTITLNSQIVKILNPLGISPEANESELYDRANSFCQYWINYGLNNGLSMKDILGPFGIEAKNHSMSKLHALMASAWVDLYLDKKEISVERVQ